MKKMFGKALFASAALSIALTAGVANADSITASLFSPLPPSGTTPTVIDLTGISTPSQATIHGAGYTVTFATAGNQGVEHGANPGVSAIPVAGVTGTTPEYLSGNYGSSLTTSASASGNYLSTGTGTITIDFSTPQISLALLWGSIDTSNSLTFNDASGFKVTGTDVQTAAAGFISNGFQGPGGSAYVVVDTTTPFTTVTATSGVVSFEFAGVAGDTGHFTATPEPASFFLFGLGIGLIAFGAYRRYQAAHQS